ncbi:MAG TPA: M48 family metalloprotease [Longimicrobiales bacterium]|nr:M48 family metalloprotease [Longimicrobiales bacterium]
MRRLTLLASMPLLAVLPLSSGCATNPVTGERQLALISESQEIQMGQEAAVQAAQSIGLVEDAALQSYVARIGSTMAAQSERPDLPWSFQVVDDPTPNAFALPGGPIFVTRGILALMGSEAELAGVLGHEIGHITARHSVTLLSRAQLAQLTLGVGSILVPEIAQLGQLAGAGLQLLFLSYGRDAERQADDLGFGYALRQNYDVREMVNMFAQLQRASQAAGQSPLPTWLASHPYPEERIERIQQALATLNQDLSGTKKNVDVYMNRIDNLVYGDNPRAGFFEGGLFLHPDLRFRMQFPQGWQTQNLAQSVSALSPQKDAVIQLTLAQGSETQAANQFFGQQGIASSQVSRTTINGFPAVTGYFQGQTQDGVVAGVAAFISFENRTYQILSFTPAQQLQRYDQLFRSVVGSFDRLTDSRALNVQPNRISIVRPSQAMTLEEFNRRYPSRIDIAELALINQLQDGNSRIPAGTPVKRIVTGQ